MVKVVIYESKAKNESDIAVDRRWRVIQRMQSAHVARIDVDYNEIKLARQKQRSQPIVFLMQFGTDETTRFKCVYYVRGDGGYHRTVGGVQVFYPADASVPIVSVSHEEDTFSGGVDFDKDYKDETISLATGLGADAKMLRELWERVIFEDWLLRVIRIVRHQQCAAQKAFEEAIESDKEQCESDEENATAVLLAFQAVYSILNAEIRRLDEQQDEQKE